MAHDIINKLLHHWRTIYFTEPALVLALIFCFVIGLRYHYNEKERIYFLVYIIAGLILFFVANPIDILQILKRKKLAIFSEMANTLFELIELIAFYYFFAKCFQNKKYHNVPKIFLISFCVIVGVFFIKLCFPNYTVDSIRRHSLLVNVIEFFFLAVMCLLYFYGLFTSVPKMRLMQRPSFFITTSTFFYSVLMIPFFVIAHDMLKNGRTFFWILFGCHYILLTIVILTIAKGFLCRKPITT